MELVDRISQDCRLRDYQHRIFTRVVGLLEGGSRTVLIESPTGSGKSRMGLAVVKYMEESRGWRTNWVAMRHRLLRQVAEENALVANAELLRPLSMFASEIPPAELTVVDEAQHDAAATCVNVHSQSHSQVILGLTATPFRTDSLKLAFEHVIKDAGIHRLIRDGWLSPFHHWALQHHTPEHVAEAYLADPVQWGKTVVFFHRIDQCEEFARLVGQGGHHCEVVIGGRPNYTEGQLDAFDRREFSVVANAMALTEGYDDEELETVFVRDSAKVPSIQMAGRALRISPRSGKTHANIVQSVNTPWPFTRTATPARASVLKDGRWFALGSTEAIEQQSRAMVAKLAASSVQLPAFFLGKSKGENSRGGEDGPEYHLERARPDVDANGNVKHMTSDAHGRITNGSVV